MRNVKDPADDRHDTLISLDKFILSRREREVLQCSADGASTKEIAQLLNISEHTVKDYVTAACVKLEAKNRTQAVAKALRQSLIK